jgi:hypothetical protein
VLVTGFDATAGGAREGEPVVLRKPVEAAALVAALRAAMA